MVIFQLINDLLPEPTALSTTMPLYDWKFSFWALLFYLKCTWYHDCVLATQSVVCTVQGKINWATQNYDATEKNSEPFIRTFVPWKAFFGPADCEFPQTNPMKCDRKMNEEIKVRRISRTSISNWIVKCRLASEKSIKVYFFENVLAPKCKTFIYHTVCTATKLACTGTYFTSELLFKVSWHVKEGLVQWVCRQEREVELKYSIFEEEMKR